MNLCTSLNLVDESLDHPLRCCSFVQKQSVSLQRPSACKDETALLCGAPSPQAFLRWNALTQPIGINPVNRKAMRALAFSGTI